MKAMQCDMPGSLLVPSRYRQTYRWDSLAVRRGETLQLSLVEPIQDHEATECINPRSTIQLPSPDLTTDQSSDSVASGYDVIAEAYLKHVFLELKDKPFDREFLDRFASSCQEDSLVLDLGCGPGHVGQYLTDRAVRVCGVDISQRMVDLARQLNPGMRVVRADMRTLPFEAGTVGGVIAFYSIIHLPFVGVGTAFREMARVLRPGGILATAFHVDDKVLQVDELWGIKTRLDFMFFEPAQIGRALTEAGFVVIYSVERQPYDESIEAQTRRCYIVARRPPPTAA
jgi:SAM-dependent methyltransferase